MNTAQSPVYQTSVEQKRHAQDVAKRKRMGAQMPKLREMLREVCMQDFTAKVTITIEDFQSQKYRKRIIETRNKCTDVNRDIQLVSQGISQLYL